MNNLKLMAIFAETVTTGSMSAAARRLGMSPSAVSQSIRALELQNGVTLLHRSTRKLTLTEIGERYYPHCKRLIEAAVSATDSLQLARNSPTGELRISAPVGFAHHISSALAPLLYEAPQLRLRLLLDDATIDLIDHRIDIAIRAGQLADSNWVARHLCELEVILCASPDYLNLYGAPATPQELHNHQWLALERRTELTNVSSDTFIGHKKNAIHSSSVSSSKAELIPLNLYGADGQLQNIHVEARITSNNQVALQQMCENGLGISQLVRSDVIPLLKQGTLVQILAPWRHAAIPAWAVTPRRDEDAAKVRIALKYLKKYFADLPVSSE